MSKAYQLEALKRHNVNVSELGCIMLDVAMPDLSEVIPEEWAYHSTSPDHWWIAGVQSEGHVTLLYGLLPELVDKAGVDEVLDGWEGQRFKAETLEVFASPFEDEPYSCLVARVAHGSLHDAHARLSLLPHIDTYPEYKAHVTLAYVHKRHEQDACNELRRVFPIRFEPIGLNYGDTIGGQ